jgi:glucose-6-phosphate dehydrogenase assembly protein OpcA
MENSLMAVTTVSAERLLKDLAQLWADLAAGDSQKTSSGVLRACSMTLIVAADDAQDTTTVEQTVAELMHEHPSRAIVLKPAGAAPELDARVLAQCWMPFGGRQQICCEEIEITTPDEDVDEVARVIVGLVAPDLPVVLWCRGERWFQLDGIERLYQLADKVIIDSCSFRDEESAFSTIAAIRLHTDSVADLAWTRLTGWREIIAHAFEGPNAALLKKVRSIVIEHFGEIPSVATRYLAHWLARAIPGASMEFRRVEGDSGQIAGVHLTGDDLAIGFRRHDGDAVQVTGSAHLSAVVLPHATDYHSMREELAITGHDRVFEQVYREAERIFSK